MGDSVMSNTVRSLAAISAGNVSVTNALGSVVLTFTTTVVLDPGTHVNVIAHGVNVVGRIVARKKSLSATTGLVTRTYVVQGLGNFACSRQIRDVTKANSGAGFTGARKMTESYIIRIADTIGVTVQDLMQYCMDNVVYRCKIACGAAPLLYSVPLDYSIKACWLVAATFSTVFSEYVQVRFPRCAYRFNGITVEIIDRETTKIHIITASMITGAGELVEDITDCATLVRLESCDVARCTKVQTMSTAPAYVYVPGIINEEVIPTATIYEAGAGSYDEIGLDKDFDKMRFDVTGGPVTLKIAVGQDIRHTSEISARGWLFDRYGIIADAGFIDEDFGKVNGGTDSDRDLTTQMNDIVDSIHKQMSVPLVSGELPLSSIRTDIQPGDRCVLAFDNELNGIVIDIAAVVHTQSGTKIALTSNNASYIDAKRVEIASAQYARKTGKRGGVS